jgi:predicted DNA-binding protein with PD1-like motif
MRTIVHPGPPLDQRARSIAVDTSPSVRLDLCMGEDLFTAVHAALDRLDARGGAFTLVEGNVSHLKLMTGGAGKNGLPMGFHGPHELAAPLAIVAGAGGSGVDEHGERFSHCHAAFRDAAGRLVGGHLLPGETIVGPGRLTIDLVSYVGGRFVRRDDPETFFPIFHPEAA